MGFKQSWNAQDLRNQISRMAGEMNSPYNDGWVSWSIKKDLLGIKFLLDEALEQSGNFGEEERKFFEERNKQKMWKILNDK